jgi:centromere protein C
MFLVPRGTALLPTDPCSLLIRPKLGNTYFIENISERDAKLFFTQARKIAPSDEEADAVNIATLHRLSAGAAAGVGVDGPTSGRQSSAPRSSTAAPTTQVDSGGRAMSKAPAGKRAASQA